MPLTFPPTPEQAADLTGLSVGSTPVAILAREDPASAAAVRWATTMALEELGSFPPLIPALQSINLAAMVRVAEIGFATSAIERTIAGLSRRVDLADGRLRVAAAREELEAMGILGTTSSLPSVPIPDVPDVPDAGIIGQVTDVIGDVVGAPLEVLTGVVGGLVPQIEELLGQVGGLTSDVLGLVGAIGGEGSGPTLPATPNVGNVGAQLMTPGGPVDFFLASTQAADPGAIDALLAQAAQPGGQLALDMLRQVSPAAFSASQLKTLGEILTMGGALSGMFGGDDVECPSLFRPANQTASVRPMREVQMMGPDGKCHTWKYAGRPVLYSGDVSRMKRTAKLLGKRIVRGGR